MREILERGALQFYYRPRVGVQRVRGLADVQRLLLVLAPDGRQRFRKLIVGRKRLPDPAQRERGWAIVAEVSDARIRPDAASAGAARYAIAEHEGHTHLSYELDRPAAWGLEPVQRWLGIRHDASYVATVRNPEAPAAAGTHQPAALPKPLRDRFRGRRFAPLDPPEFLDHAGVEIVLIGADDDAAGDE